jgi:glutathione S-transferase
MTIRGNSTQERITPMLTVHHLRSSQSERIVWLCEELEIPYDLVLYDRLPGSGLAPPEYKALQAFGTAPIVTDGDLALGESGAIIQYVIARYGNGRLGVAPQAANFADYLYWLHFANASMQPAGMVVAMLNRSGAGADTPLVKAMQGRVDKAWAMIEARLGQVPYFAGDELTGADTMWVYGLTSGRAWSGKDITPYPNLLAYLQRIGARPGYRRAMAKAEPGVELRLT